MLHLRYHGANQPPKVAQRHLVNLNDLATFVLVVEAGTFSGAAERLGVPKSTISRRVARLEEELGLALLKRATRSFDISDDGRALYERCGNKVPVLTGVPFLLFQVFQPIVKFAVVLSKKFLHWSSVVSRRISCRGIWRRRAQTAPAS